MHVCVCPPPKLLRHFGDKFQKAVKRLVAVGRVMGLQDTGKPNDPAKIARDLVTSYLVQVANMSTSAAYDNYDAEVAEALGEMTVASDLQEMAWAKEFGFDKPDEGSEQGEGENVDDLG